MLNHTRLMILMQIRDSYRLIPGLLLTVVLAALSFWLSRILGEDLLGFAATPISAGMLAILLGMLLGNVVPAAAWLVPGYGFAVKKVLRLGIIFLGIRLSVTEVLRLGLIGVPIVVVCIAGALVATIILGKWLGLPDRLGILIAVGTSICGISAIVATGPVIEAEEEEITYAVAVITVFGILATLIYPYLAHALFSGNPGKVGLFLGTSIHDTSQVAGAGLVYAQSFSEPAALDAATVTKLLRNLFITVVIPLMAFRHSRNQRGIQDDGSKKIKLVRLLPLFVVGFLLLAALRSIGDLSLHANGRAFGFISEPAWRGLYNSVKSWASRLLVVALAGVGLSTRFRSLKGLGIKPFLVGLSAALSVGIISFLLISLFGFLIEI